MAKKKAAKKKEAAAEAEEAEKSVSVELDCGGAFLAGGGATGKVRLDLKEECADADAAGLTLRAWGELTLKWTAKKEGGKKGKKGATTHEKSHQENFFEHTSDNLLETSKDAPEDEANEEEKGGGEEGKEEERGGEGEKSEEAPEVGAGGEEEEEGENNEEEEDGEGGDEEDGDSDGEEEEEEKKEDDDGGGARKLPKGVSEFSFYVPLPATLPSTFNSNKDGGRAQVRYKIQATFNRGDGAEGESSSEVPLSVAAVVDLNSPQVQTPQVGVAPEVRMFAGAGLLPCCGGGGPVSVSAQVPMTGLVPGEKLPLTVNINNRSGRKVDAFVSFKRRMQWTKKEMQVVQDAVGTLGAEPDEADLVEEEKVTTLAGNGFFNQVHSLQIPPTAPALLGSCPHVEDEFYVSVRVEVAPAEPGEDPEANNFAVKVPVLVGNVPYSAQFAFFESPEASAEGDAPVNLGALSGMPQENSPPDAAWAEDPLGSAGRYPTYRQSADTARAAAQGAVAVVAQQPMPAVQIQLPGALVV